MASTVDLPGGASGYLALPESGSGPGVLVVQEWWGLAPQLTRVCDRLAQEGFVALAPDLYHGELAEHDEMDKAAALMNALPMDRAAADMDAAVDFLLAHDGVTSDEIGIVGFCMGGMLTLVMAARGGDRIGAAVPYYGYPGDDPPDWSNLTAPVLGHFASDDGFFALEGALELERTLRAQGKDVTFTVYPGTDHAFANEDDPFHGNYAPEAANQAWIRTVDFLHANLD